MLSTAYSSAGIALLVFSLVCLDNFCYFDCLGLCHRHVGRHWLDSWFPRVDLLCDFEWRECGLCPSLQPCICCIAWRRESRRTNQTRLDQDGPFHLGRWVYYYCCLGHRHIVHCDFILLEVCIGFVLHGDPSYRWFIHCLFDNDYLYRAFPSNSFGRYAPCEIVPS
jgi:hypothetical protein